MDWQGTVLLEMGSQGDAWLNPSQQCTLSTEQTKHTLTKHTLTGQHMEGLFGSPLLKSGEATFRIQPSFGTKRLWKNWNWSTGGVPKWLPREHDLQGGWRKQGLSVWHGGI